jgi:sulfur-carrier protein
MAIEVRIPTILRTYTGGAKQVEGTGATLGELIVDLEQRNGGLRDRLVDDGGLRRFVNVYLNDEDVRFLAGLDTPVKDGDTVTVLPAVAGGQGGYGGTGSPPVIGGQEPEIGGFRGVAPRASS